MTEKIRIDVPITPPDSIFALCNDVMQQGVIHLLVPPPDLLSKWIEENGTFIDDEVKKETFKRYWRFDKMLNEDDAVEQKLPETMSPPQSESGTSNGDSILEQIAPFVGTLISRVQEKVLFTLVYKMLNLYVSLPEELASKDALPAADSIAESISRLRPLRKATDLVPEISEAVLDLLRSIKSDLESDAGKQVFKLLDETDDPLDAEFFKIKNDLEKKHHYAEQCIKEAHRRLLPAFIQRLDGIMEDLCEYLRDRVYTRVEEMLIEDRENIPGPQHME